MSTTATTTAAEAFNDDMTAYAVLTIGADLVRKTSAARYATWEDAADAAESAGRRKGMVHAQVVTAAPSTAIRKLRAIKAVHRVCTSGQFGAITVTRDEAAATIRTLAPLVKSAKWTDAVESYACFVEDTENPLSWAYSQGSVYFAYSI